MTAATAQASRPKAAKKQRTKASLDASKSAKAGRDNEEWIERLNQRCLDQDVAFVHRHFTPMRIIGREGAIVRAVQSKAQGADFRGIMLDGSKREVRVEAKRTSDPTGRFAFADIRESQRADLERCDRNGGVAVLLLSFGDGPQADLFALPWSGVRAAIGNGVRSVDTSNVGAFRVQSGACYLWREARWAK